MLVLNSRFPFIHNVEERASVNIPQATWDSWWDTGYGTNTAGLTVNENSALKHSAYWRAVNLISSQMASFPIGLFKRLPNGNTEEILNHPAVRLLTRQPNNIMTPFIWKESSQANVLTKGNAYSYINRDNRGNPLSLMMMDSSEMKPKVEGNQIVYEFFNETFDPYFILHIPGLSFDGARGKSVLEAAAESMGVGLAMQKYSANFYKNGAKQSGFLSHPMPLSEQARLGLRKSFDKNIKGPEGGTMVLDEGMKYLPNSTPPIDQQLLQLKQFSVQEIARWFGIPPFLLFEESRSTFTNIQDQGLSFIIYTLTQWVERWEAELRAKLLTEDERNDHFFKFNMDSLMRGNPVDRASYHAKMAEYGFVTINEVRRKEDLNSIDGGDEHLIQVNRQPLNTINDGKGIEVPPGTS